MFRDTYINKTKTTTHSQVVAIIVFNFVLRKQ